MTLRLISSRDNPQYKQLKQLATSSQARRKQAKTLLDGVHLCQAWLQHRGKPELCIVGESARSHAEVAAVLHQCEILNSDCVVLPDSLFSSLSQVEQGVSLLFVIGTPENATLPQLNQLCVLIDAVQDPGNLGSILRTTAAAGIKHVVCSERTVFAWSPKVLRAGMGAHFQLDIIEDADLKSLITTSTVPVYATDLHANQSIYAVDLTQPCAWLFGNEGKGVSDELLSCVSARLNIPQAIGVESLNVAAAAAVCLFEQKRQCEHKL
ncbi:MAG: RNA methyltransferase [Oxalobacteraceae bacterium]|nr:RNA methyltransferase [Oxalobacteraceae bacterium]